MAVDVKRYSPTENTWLLVPWAALIVGAFLLPQFISQFNTSLVIQMLTFAVFGVAFNLAFGHAGVPSFGHAAFFGIGVYGIAIGLEVTEGSLLLAIALTFLAAAVYGLVIGAISTQGKGIYFALLTFAFAQFLYEYIIRADITGSESGKLIYLPEMAILGFTPFTTDGVYYISLTVLLLLLAFSYRLLQSPLGRAMKSIHGNQERAESIGYPVRRVKTVVFTISGVLATTAGILTAFNTQFASPSNAGFLISVDAFVITIIGGVSTIFGPVIGAVVFVGLDELGRSYGDIGTLIYGALLVLFIIFLPRGIYGHLKEYLI